MNTQRTGGASGRAAAVGHAAGGRAQAPGVGGCHAGAADAHRPTARASRIAGEADAPGTRSGTPAGAVGGVAGAARRHPACEP
ncbi:hypothetical protein ACWGJ0_29900 [Streptomyces massasporeus]